MKRKDYVRPTAQVVELRVTNQLLAGSGNVENYDWNDYEEEARPFDNGDDIDF